jgi:phosphate/sulfate permease
MTLAIILIILFVLFALLDLVVGVTNNAVNFLNSAIGSKVATRRTILWVASLGLVLGSLFASGMMDLAKNGVISQQHFAFTDLVAIFSAVMITNILIIDVLNTHGFPTSTTTAFILELIGGALAIAIYKDGFKFSILGVVNTNEVFLILAGIFLSVFLAFILGTFIQFLSRLLFSFRNGGKLGWLFALTGAAGVTVIAYLIIKQALYTDMFEVGEWYNFVNQHIIEVLVGVFSATFFIMWLATSLFNVNIPGWVVLLGTFAMAMSFTSNDLVNFIGVPLAAIESAVWYLVSGQTSEMLKMGIMNEQHQQVIGQGWYFLFFVMSALVMAATLFLSPKTKRVLQTEMYLERQGKGIERFEASYFSRLAVRNFVNFYHFIHRIIPVRVTQFLKKRFEPVTDDKHYAAAGVPVYFDTIRASVNLVVASSMIMVGTWYSIPLSTTFVIFMVSMGSSLADGAWDRDNAVYRISGVITILGSWFLTSCAAILGAFIITLLICYGGVVMLLILSVLLFVVFYRSNFKARHEQTPTENDDTDILPLGSELSLRHKAELFRRYIMESSKLYLLVIQDIMVGDDKMSTQLLTQCQQIEKSIKANHSEVIQESILLSQWAVEAGQHLDRAFSYMEMLSYNLQQLVQLADDVDNLNVHSLRDSLLNEVQEEMTTWFNFLIHEEKESRFDDLPALMHRQQILIAQLDELRQLQLKGPLTSESDKQTSLLIIDILTITKNIVMASLNVVNSHYRFVLILRAESLDSSLQR